MRLHPRTRFSSVLRIECSRNVVRLAAMSAVGIVFGVLANHANATTNLYFDTNGTTAGYGVVNGGTYSWEASSWATATGGLTATSAWIPASFARFNGAVSGNTYTVTLGTEESMAGLFETVSGVNLIINASNASGDFNITTAGGVVAVGGTDATLQGFLITGATSNVTINAAITGAGGIEQQQAGALSLYGNNTYSGGTETTGGQLTNYNNANSFGTGTITIMGAGIQGFVNNSGSQLKIANNFVVATNTTTNFVSGNGTSGTAGTNWTGTFTLLSSTATPQVASIATFDMGTATSVTQISGVISGDSTVSVKFANPGTFILSGANTYSGTTTVSAGTLKLGAANTIASSSSLILAGGTLNPDGFNQSMGATTLGLTSSSTMDFSVGASAVSFADSSGLTWTGTLNLVNYNAGLDALQFGNSLTGLTSAQLADIEFNGAGLGTARLNANGVVISATAAAPEPASWALLGSGAFGMLSNLRRRARKS